MGLRLRPVSTLLNGLHATARSAASSSFRSRVERLAKSIYSRHAAMRVRTVHAVVVCAVTAAWLVPLTLGGTVRPVSSPPQSYYLALGDSIAYGFQPAKAKAGLPPSRFNTGYVDVFAARLRTIAPKIRVVNYGCPGESTKTFIHGGCPGRRDVKGLHDAFKGAQLDAALASSELIPARSARSRSASSATTWASC